MSVGYVAVVSYRSVESATHEISILHSSGYTDEGKLHKHVESNPGIEKCFSEQG
jgi:hypothetical protein